MGRLRKGQDDADRYLAKRQGKFYYKRRVPTDLVGQDDRGDIVTFSLKTSDVVQARRLRDVYEQADDELWASLLQGNDASEGQRRYKAAVARAKSMGFAYRPAAEIASQETLESILRCIESASMTRPIAEAVVGAITRPATAMSDAFKDCLKEIAPQEIVGKSEGQRTRWTNGKQQSIDSFIEVVGDIDIEALTREDARKYYDHWLKRIAPSEGKPTHTASIGNRRFGDLRGFYRAHFTRLGEPDRVNPFDKLTFKEKKKRKGKRPPFPHEWITGTILQSPKLLRMNEEARHIMLVVADIGARPGEICNLTPELIVLNHPVPHLKIEPRDDPEDPREIKTESSVRVVPLSGLALEVMKKHPNGFPKYKDKESSFSATVNKFMRENKLFPTEKHSVYSFRHSFEDRMKEARVDSELRRILMGHAVDRAEYGEGGSLKLRLEEIKKVALPYDPEIV